MLYQEHLVNYHDVLWNRGVATYDSLTTGVVRSYFDSKKVSVNEGCFVPGKFRVNPYSVSQEATSSSQGYIHFVKTASAWAYLDQVKSGPTGLVVTPSRYTANLPLIKEGRKTAALQKALSKVGQSSLDVGVELGELRETLEGLRHPLKDVRKWFFRSNYEKLLRFRSLVQAARSGLGITSDLANTWLEVRYGLLPLLSSIKSIGEYATEKAQTIAADRIRSVGSRIIESGSVFNSVPYLVMGNAGLSYDVTTDYKYVYRAKVYYRMLWERNGLQKLGLSFEYLPEIVWELTRLSFVVDWLFSVGPWLGQFRVKPGICILGNTVSVRQSITGKATMNPKSDSVFEFKEATGGVGEYVKNAYDRAVDVKPSVLPHFRYSDAVSLTHTVDALALIWQPLEKRLRKSLYKK